MFDSSILICRLKLSLTIATCVIARLSKKFSYIYSAPTMGGVAMFIAAVSSVRLYTSSGCTCNDCLFVLIGCVVPS